MNNYVLCSCVWVSGIWTTSPQYITIIIIIYIDLHEEDNEKNSVKTKGWKELPWKLSEELLT